MCQQSCKTSNFFKYLDTEKFYDVNNCKWVWYDEPWYKEWPMLHYCYSFYCHCFPFGSPKCPKGWLDTEKKTDECEEDYCIDNHPGFGPSCTLGEKKWCCKKL